MSAFVQSVGSGKNKILELYRANNPNSSTCESFSKGKTICEVEIEDLAKYNYLYLIWKASSSSLSHTRQIPVNEIANINDTSLFASGDKKLMLNLTGNVLKIYNGSAVSTSSGNIQCYGGTYTADDMGTVFFLA